MKINKNLLAALCCAALSALTSSCYRHTKEVDYALELAGENRVELEKVLTHYQGNTLKLKAARFLIANMPGHFVTDSASYARLKPFYNSCDSVRRLYKSTQYGRWAILIDSLWEGVEKDPDKKIQHQPLIKSLNVHQLISYIDEAFEAWQGNAFTKDSPFDEFCEYVLPPYRGNSHILDNTRAMFRQWHGNDLYKDTTHSFLSEVDSTLVLYKEIGFDSFYESNVEILSAKALTQIGAGRCQDRGVFNSQLLSAMGVAATMDFTPSWGNKAGQHSWNVIIHNGKHYATDPFWHSNNWVYNDLYSNKEVYDPEGYGVFRFAKIFRKTYSTLLESTLLEQGMPMEDIPPLFRNYKMKDVSGDYFETADVELELHGQEVSGHKYAYLAVYSQNDPVIVQYGKIEDGKAVFKGMGKNIVYFPVYYKGGTIEMASSPFLLTTTGQRHYFNLKGNTTTDMVVINGVEPDYYRNRHYRCSLRGATLMRRLPEGKTDTLLTLPELSTRRTHYLFDSEKGCRYLRLYLPSDSLALGDLSFFSNSGKRIKPIITSKLTAATPKDSLHHLTDGYSHTCYCGKTNLRYVDFDLGQEHYLLSMMMEPYQHPVLYPNSSYELYYWKDGWKSAGKPQQGGVDFLRFDNVPPNALLRLRQTTTTDRKVKERIFCYQEGEVIWL